MRVQLVYTVSTQTTAQFTVLTICAEECTHNDDEFSLNRKIFFYVPSVFDSLTLTKIDHNKITTSEEKKTVRSGETHKTQSIWVRMHFFGSLLHTNAQQLHNTIRMHILSQPEPVTNVFSHAKLQTTIASHGTVVYIFDWVANVRARAHPGLRQHAKHDCSYSLT